MSLLREYLEQNDEIKKSESPFQVLVDKKIKTTLKKPLPVIRPTNYKEEFITAVTDKDFKLAEDILLEYKESISVRNNENKKNIIIDFIRDANSGRPYIVDVLAKYSDYSFIQSLAKYGLDVNDKFISKHLDDMVNIVAIGAYEKNYSLVLDCVKTKDLNLKSKSVICSFFINCFFDIKKAKDLDFFDFYKKVEPFLLDTPIFGKENLGYETSSKANLSVKVLTHGNHYVCDFLNTLLSSRHFDNDTFVVLKRVKKVLDFFGRSNVGEIGLMQADFNSVEKLLILNELDLLDLSKGSKLRLIDKSDMHVLNSMSLGSIEALNIWLYMWNERPSILPDFLKMQSCKTIIRELYTDIKDMKSFGEKIPIDNLEAYVDFEEGIGFQNDVLYTGDFKKGVDYEKLLFGVSKEMSADGMINRIYLIKSVFEGFLDPEILQKKYEEMVHGYMATQDSEYRRNDLMTMLVKRYKKIAISVNILQYVDSKDIGFYAELEKKLIEGVGKKNKKITSKPIRV